MEPLLSNIEKDTNNSTKLKNINTSAKTALDFLNSYSRAPSSEYRKQVLQVVSACLETNIHRQCVFAKQILEKMGRDNRFYDKEEETGEKEGKKEWELEEEKENYMAFQVVLSLQHLPVLGQESQVDLLQALLYLSCQPYWNTSGQVTLQIISLCEEVCGGGTSVRVAAQNTATSCIAVYCRQVMIGKSSPDQLLPTLQYIVSKIEQHSRNDDGERKKKDNFEQEFLISCLEVALFSLENVCEQSEHFSTFVWRNLCPAIIRCLIRGHGYNLATSAVHLLGQDMNQRPVLEAIFDRMLVQVSPEKRLPGLKAVHKLVLAESGQLKFALQAYNDTQAKGSNDMALFVMLFEVLDECTDVNDPELINECLEIINQIMTKLKEWVEGEGLQLEMVEFINKTYPSLKDADYIGPYTYSAGGRIPAEFMKITADVQKAETEQSVSEYGLHEDELDDSFDSSDTSHYSDDTNIYRQTKKEENEHEKIPKYLHSPKSDTSEEELEERETENANTFCKVFKNRIARLNCIRSAAEIDQKIQEFSSQFCQDFSSHSPRAQKIDGGLETILSGDGVYLTCYYAIQLSIRLRNENYFESDRGEREPCVTKNEFMKNILESGTLVYISSRWISKVYENLIETDIFGGLKISSPILNICLDLDNPGETKLNSQFLSEFRRIGNTLEQCARERKKAGVRLSRRILSAVWDYTVAISSKPNITKTTTQGLKSSLGLLVRNKKNNKFKFKNREFETVNLSIVNSLVELAKAVELHELAGSAMRIQVEIACQSNSNKKIKLKVSRFKALECLLDNGLELASHSQDCWKHIFYCSKYIQNLEQSIFRPNLQDSSTEGPKLSPGDIIYPGSARDQGWLGFMKEPASRTYKDLDQILKLSNINDFSLALSKEVAELCISHLSQKIEKVYHGASNTLNMKALLGFLQELVFQSRKQLITCQTKQNGGNNLYPEVLLLTKLTDSMLQIIKSARPLVHVMLSWAIAGQHFMEGGGHSHLMIAKLSVQAIHDSISNFLHHHTEISYFHFNESLFKPYESLIMLELCDQDVQDQIISSIQQFVEGSPSEIRSGCKPLFGALRSLKFYHPNLSRSITEHSHIGAILDVFEAFLSTDNPVVFAHAALNCVMCLIKYIKGSMEQRELEELVDIRDVCTPTPGICESALGYIIRCHSILAKMYLMPACPVFWGSQKINMGNQPITVSSTLLHIQVVSFDPETDTLLDFPFSFSTLETQVSSTLSFLHRSGLIRVWFILLDGLVSALSSCPLSSQAETINTFFTLMDSMKCSEFISFGLFCINHLLLPAIQNWTRATEKLFQGWERSGAGMKQTLGLTVDLVLDVLNSTREDNRFDIRSGSYLMLKQLVIVLVECTVVSNEHIARFSCSCFKHLIQSQGEYFEESEWELVILSLCRSLQLTLYPVHQLMASFKPGSSRFYGDVGSVKIAARRDSTLKDSNRINQLAHQVLLLEEQRDSGENIPGNPDDEDRSYLFLLEPNYAATSSQNIKGQQIKKEDSLTIRVTMRSLVTSLIAHNILINIIQDITEAAGFKIKTEQAKLLILVLKQSAAAAQEFDSRPGLKFLVQKVAHLPSAANLYTQTVLAWTTRANLLISLCKSETKLYSLTSTDIKQLIQDNRRNYRKGEPGEPNSHLVFIQLYDLILNLAEIYSLYNPVSRLDECTELQANINDYTNAITGDELVSEPRTSVRIDDVEAPHEELVLENEQDSERVITTKSSIFEQTQELQNIEKNPEVTPEPNNTDQNSEVTQEPETTDQNSEVTHEPNTIKQNSEVTPEPNTIKQNSESTPEPNTTEQNSEVTPEPNTTEQNSAVTPEPNTTDHFSEVTPEPSNTEQNSEVTPEPNTTEQNSEVTPIPETTEQNSEVTLEPNTTEQNSEATPEPETNEQDSGVTPEPNTTEQNSEVTPEPETTDQNSEATPEPNTTKHNSEVTPEPDATEQNSEVTPEPNTTEQNSEVTPEPNTTEQNSEVTPESNTTKLNADTNPEPSDNIKQSSQEAKSSENANSDDLKVQVSAHNCGKTPFSFSDFVAQPHRPDSPNLSIASDEGTACNGVNALKDKDDEIIPTSEKEQSREESTEHLHKLDKEMSILPIDPFAFHHPYLHMATREFTYSAWYLVILTSSLEPGKPETDESNPFPETLDVYNYPDLTASRISIHKEQKPDPKLEKSGLKHHPQLELSGSSPHQPGSKPHPQLEISGSKPNPQLEISGSRPHLQMERTGLKLHPQLENSSSRSHSKQEQTSSKPNPQLELSSSRSNSKLERNSSKSHPELEQAGSKPYPNLELSSSKPPQLNPKLKLSGLQLSTTTTRSLPPSSPILIQPLQPSSNASVETTSSSNYVPSNPRVQTTPSNDIPSNPSVQTAPSNDIPSNSWVQTTPSNDIPSNPWVQTTPSNTILSNPSVQTSTSNSKRGTKTVKQSMSTKSAKSDEIHEISANNHASSIEVDEPMISEEIQYEDERVDVSQNNAEHPVTGLKSLSIVPPNMTETEFSRIMIGALCKSLKLSLSSVQVNSVRSSVEQAVLNISLDKPTLHYVHTRLMNLRVLMVAGNPVHVYVKSGKLEHLYLSQEKAEDGNLILLLASFCLGLLGLLVTCLVLVYFGAKILQRDEEDDENKDLIEQDFLSEEITNDETNEDEQGSFISPEISFIELGFPSFTNQQSLIIEEVDAVAKRPNLKIPGVCAVLNHLNLVRDTYINVRT
ncbi:uncharacterized protein LOC111706238 isoform X2 [Eurytemora carolleeae]|uniref:uncharacterized protein LOC111706238 isoform X2 n=1 Tax=Eurytemora carolleeae TaxID=1294199 RepID=UPI000C77B109|nr:uncharacterized protein LOC111706238 isoform X2 [Eurytemora carolleeae]|eukprot:XP_023334828.1 uncharacterized protein LOC111706238 isoform X2 [Eurytemora affinis]